VYPNPPGFFGHVPGSLNRGMSAGCSARTVPLFADAGNGWPHNALRYH